VGWEQQILPWQVLIHFQVRSHPALVLPAPGGRCSLGLWGLWGLFSGYPRFKIILSCTSPHPASRIWLYFRVLRNIPPEIAPKSALLPYRLSALPVPRRLSSALDLAYRFTSCTGVPHGPLTYNLKSSARPTGVLRGGGVGLLSSRVYHRAQSGRDGLPYKQGASAELLELRRLSEPVTGSLISLFWRWLYLRSVRFQS